MTNQNGYDRDVNCGKNVDEGSQRGSGSANAPIDGGNSSQWNQWMNNFQSLFSSNTQLSNDSGLSLSTRVNASNGSSSFVTSAIVSPDESLKFHSTQMTILAPGQLPSSARDDDETRWLHEDSIDASSTKYSIYKGIIFSSLSSLCFSLCAAIVKYLKDIHPGELAVFRFLGIFLLSIPLVYNHGYEPFGPPNLRHYLLLRGITGATSLFLRFLAFRHLPIADASVIIFSVPIFVSIFACVFLDESCGFFQVAIVSLTMIGLGLTTKLPTLFGSSLHEDVTSREILFTNNTFESHANNSVGTSNNSLINDIISNASLTSYPRAPETLTWSGEHLVGITAALTSTIFAASVYIVIKKAKTVHYSVIMFNFGWVALIETMILTLLMDGYSMPTKSIEWFYILILALLSFTGQVLLTRSLQLEAAGVVAVVRAATDISLAFIWQMLFFSEFPDAWSTSGAIIVTLCVVLTGTRKWLLTLPDHDDLKIKLSKFIK